MGRAGAKEERRRRQEAADEEERQERQGKAERGEREERRERGEGQEKRGSARTVAMRRARKGTKTSKGKREDEDKFYSRQAATGAADLARPQLG